MNKPTAATPLRQPHAALADLCDGFFDNVDFLASCPRFEPENLPERARKLLVHREHMTLALGEHFGAPVELRVLAERRNDEFYSRKILLTPRGANTIAELGIVRLGLRYLAPAVRDEILAGVAPLGDILIRHEVMRRISPRWYFAFPPSTPIAAAFERAGATAHGRVGTIYCDDEPAIDLLECVAP